MRNILRVGAAVFALLVATNVASAQGGGGGGGGARGGGGGRGGPQGERMSMAYLNEITLDDAQKGKLTPIVAWYDSASTALPRPAQDADSTARATAMQARQKLTADFQAKIKAILTPDQVTKFDANVAAQGQRGRRGGGH